MLNSLIEMLLKEVDPNVALVCITSYFGLRFMVKKIEDFLVIFLPCEFQRSAAAF